MASNPGAITIYLGLDLVADLDRYLASQVASMSPEEILVASRKHKAPTRSSVIQAALKQFLTEVQHA